MTRFAVLGPVIVTGDDGGIALKSGIPRTILAMLLLNANKVVSGDQLATAVWGDNPPASSSESLRNHVMRLRRKVGAGTASRIETVAPGYLVTVKDGELDADDFLDAYHHGGLALRSGDWPGASERLAEGLALWRGEAYCDLPAEYGAAEAQRLDEARLVALEWRLEADLCLGRHEEVIAELQSHARSWPQREAFHGQLMLALYRADRQAEALESFRRLRRALVDELGVEPSPTVRELHQRILAADPGLALPRTAQSSETARAARRQLPADTRFFIGRDAEVGELLALARQASQGDTPDTTLVISAIDGMAGVGKTALALHVAHRVGAQFPDGHLFLDLQGYTLGLEPLSAADALGQLLRRLEVPEQRIPRDLADRAAFYRGQLTGTRTLIILDDAVSAAQIRPLLPGSPGCLVLVTSRKRLPSLDDAYSVSLDVLSPSEAVHLLSKVCGRRDLYPGHPSLAELAALCGNMPLAVRIAGARLRHRRSLRVEELVDQLRAEHSRLSRLEDEDRSLTAVFASSYASLPTAEQLLFRCLGELPGSDLDVHAAASLIGTDSHTAEILLESLLGHNLLVQLTIGRYQMHDLVRCHARACRESDPGEERAAARQRLLGFYLRGARNADALLSRKARSVVLEDQVDIPGVVTPALADRGEALAWMTAERDNLVAAIAFARAQSEHTFANGLTQAMAAFLLMEGPWQLAWSLHGAAAEAARRTGLHLDEANALFERGSVAFFMSEYAAAVSMLEQATEIFHTFGAERFEATALLTLGKVNAAMGDYSNSSAFLERALQLYRQMDNRTGEGDALSELGRARYAVGDISAAAKYLENARLIYQLLGDDIGEANSLWHLGRLQLAAGNVRDAEELIELALSLYRGIGSRLGEANTLAGLSRVKLELADHFAAAELAGQAMAISLELGYRLGVVNAQQNLGRALHAAGRRAEAAELLDKAVAEYREIGDLQSESETLNRIATLTLETAGASRALELYRQALALAQQIHSPIDEADALTGIARCEAER